MSWSNMIGHREIIERFARLVARDKLASTFLFVGPEGIGKRLFAEGLAEVLLCQRREAGSFAACGQCPSCIQVRSQSHPDVLRVEKPEDKNVLPIELFVGDREHRAEEGLCRDIRLKPTAGSRKIAIIDDADYLNQESANVLLKTLEEPPPRAVIILIGTSPQRQLPTILSRCQLVSFSPLMPEEVALILERMTDLETTIPLTELSAASMGSIKIARKLADPTVFEFRTNWLEQLATLDPGQDEFGASIVKFSESNTKEAAEKRENLYFVADLAIHFYRQLLARILVQPFTADSALKAATEAAAARWQASLSLLGRSIERLCDFQARVEANANAANAVDPLLSDLRRLARGHRALLPQS
jgi:DNA polymerase III subunit delta'